MAQNYISFGEGTIQTIKSTCKQGCEDTKATLKKLRDTIDKICNDTEYEPLILVLDELITVKINTELPKTVDGIADNWITNAYVAHARNQGIEESLETARKLDTDLASMAKTFWKGKPFGDSIQAKKVKSEMNAAKYDELKKAFDGACTELSTNREKHSNKLKTDSKNSVTTEIAVPILEAIFTPLEKALETFATNIEKYKEEAEARDVSRRQENLKIQSFANKTGASTEQLTAMMQMFKNKNTKK